MRTKNVKSWIKKEIKTQLVLCCTTSGFSLRTSLMKNNILHQSGFSFLVKQLTDQLCRIKPRRGPFFPTSTINCNSDWDPDCLLAMSLIWFIFPEERLWCSLLFGKMYCHHEIWPLHHQASRLMEWSMSTCVFTVEKMTAIFPCPLPDINPISSMIVEMFLFSSETHLYMFHVSN